MNKDNAAQFVPLVQALADGKIIQLKTIRDEWKDWNMENINFSEPVEFYRIKPEPVVFYALFNRNGTMITRTSTLEQAQDRLASYAARHHMHGVSYVIKKFVEAPLD